MPKRQQQRRLVQTVIVGFTAVRKPVAVTNTGKDAHEKCVRTSSETKVPTAGYIVEIARRRVRNRTGRYEMEHEVQYGVRRGGPSARRWLSAAEFEELLEARKIEGDLGAGDGV
ncbi:hypothetical protein PHYSODRAFT_246877 [Phytophthora sojae]|uniref:Uncharacterized protein n=1 Tax=Phytophthora sojae (strain P6497) TaxID=1094619 RepID=G4ZZ12_PHYSP|nr:hypothetical protein PHYSODRAFT_246877 [Phytophthora sojae]EGZ12195.1 hypothetical protein PHYSODRAFT_246877 [Phytophthora sojae]|eukprot:XP_009532528.1 hypothetical protein PHYSODRAFT_246877 [Phytophthora sojae]